MEASQLFHAKKAVKHRPKFTLNFALPPCLRGGGGVEDYVVGGDGDDSRWPLWEASPSNRGVPAGASITVNVTGWAPLIDSTTMVDATDKPGRRFGVSSAPVQVRVAAGASASFDTDHLSLIRGQTDV